MSALVVVIVVATIAMFSDFSGTPEANTHAMSPGPVADVHASFTREIGCAACHQEHNLQGIEWLGAAFESHDQDGQCLGCHEFSGADRPAHNDPSLAGKVEEPRCAACHTEHKGTEYKIAEVTDKVCANCHEPTVTQFVSDHPAFPPAFPYQIPNNVNFDHAKHLTTYFEADSKWVKQDNRDPEFAKAAKAACTTCHVIETASREVSPRPFEQTCSKCHQHQLVERPMVLYTPDEVTPLLGLILGIPEDADEDEALAKVTELMENLSESGTDGLAEIIAEQTDETRPKYLLEGLDTTLLKSAAAAWANEEEFEAPEQSDIDTGGWRAGEDDDGNQSLRYLPRRHSDAVMVNWVAYLRALRASKDEGTAALATAALDYVLDDTAGAGACGKCHRAGLQQGKSELSINDIHSPDWRFTGPSDRPHTTYSHGPHISLLGPDVSCKNCHTLSPGADYAAYFADPSDTSAYISNFRPIDKPLCERCHSDEKVTIACQTCHKYHRPSGFRREFKVLSPDHGQARNDAAIPPPAVVARSNT